MCAVDRFYYPDKDAKMVRPVGGSRGEADRVGRQYKLTTEPQFQEPLPGFLTRVSLLTCNYGKIRGRRLVCDPRGHPPHRLRRDDTIAMPVIPSLSRPAWPLIRYPALLGGQIGYLVRDYTDGFGGDKKLFLLL